MTPLLYSLMTAPSSPLDLGAVTSTQLSAFIFSHLLRSSPKAKPLSLSIYPPVAPSDKESSFFVPADGAPPPSQAAVEPDEQEPPQSLLQTIIENLTLSLLSRSRADASDSDLREWDRLVVAYLCLLSQWLWDDPKVVKEFLDAGGLGMVC
jgi:intracellular protein transport protein USO1